jgi:hypothetical protein
MNNHKRVLQIGLDIVVGPECTGGELAEEVANELSKRGFTVAGVSFIDDLTECYEDHYPELLKEV